MTQEDNERPREQWATTTDEHRTDFERPESPFKYQFGAWVLWLVGLVVAFGSVLCATGGVYAGILTDMPVLTAILAIVIDVLVVLVAQLLWRQASALKGAKRQGLLGVIMACLAFPPMVLFFLFSKNASRGMKVAATIAAVISIAALIVVGVVIPRI